MVIDQLDSQNACMIADNQTSDSAMLNCSFQVCIMLFNSRAEQWHRRIPKACLKIAQRTACGFLFFFFWTFDVSLSEWKAKLCLYSFQTMLVARNKLRKFTLIHFLNLDIDD